MQPNRCYWKLTGEMRVLTELWGPSPGGARRAGQRGSAVGPAAALSWAPLPRRAVPLLVPLVRAGPSPVRAEGSAGACGIPKVKF